jgi:hypothetical protein
LVIVSLPGYILRANLCLPGSVRSAAVSQRFVSEEGSTVLTVIDAHSFFCFRLPSEHLMCKNNTQVTTCWNVIKSFVLLLLLISFVDNINVLYEFALAFLVYFVFIALKQYTYSFGKKCFKLFFVGSFVFVLFFCNTWKYFRAAIAMMSYNIIKLNKFDIGGVHKTLK